MLDILSFTCLFIFANYNLCQSTFYQNPNELICYFGVILLTNILFLFQAVSILNFYWSVGLTALIACLLVYVAFIIPIILKKAYSERVWQYGQERFDSYDQVTKFKSSLKFNLATTIVFLL